MGTSNGGGRCDCGDTEAWKSEPFCNIHSAGMQAKESRGNKLPKDIAERAAKTFEIVLRHCNEMLCSYNSTGLIRGLQICENENERICPFYPCDIFCTVLYNDETHTFDRSGNYYAYVRSEVLPKGCCSICNKC